MRSVPALLLFLTLLFWNCTRDGSLPVDRPNPARYHSPYTWVEGLRPSRVMVLGDLQPTSWVERTFFGRTQNDSIRDRMIERTVEERPEMLLMLGDYVSSGELEEEWLAFDRLMGPICRAKIPVRAVLGNHDHGLLRRGGHLYSNARFPHNRALPNLTLLGDSTALIVVDSNIEILPDRIRRNQAKRYRDLLRRLDADPAIKGIIVASHHPIFTNASLPINPQVRTTFLPPFMKAKKTLLFLSGHIHSYERFELEGKAFVVSGGGGGPRRKVDTTTSRPHKHNRYNHGAWRYHHYLNLEIWPQGIRCETWMLVGEEFRLGDGFVVRFSEIRTAN